MALATIGGLAAGARLVAWLRWLRRFVAVLLFGYDGFISHARADGRAYAIALWAALEQLGWTICFDREDFHAGDPLQSTLRRTVRSSRCLILLDTPRARASPWVQAEVEEAAAARRPIVPVQQADAASVTWQPPAVAAILGALIHCDETADNFARGVVRFEITDAIRASMTASSTRQRFRRAALAVAGAMVIAAVGAATTSLAASKLDRLKWTLEDRGVPLDLALGEVREFLRSPLGVLASRAFPDSTDQLLRQAAAPALKLHRAPALPRSAHVSASDRAVVVVNGATLEVREPARVTTCVLPAGRPVVAAGVNPPATIAVAVTETSVMAWRLPECRQFVNATLPASGLADRGPIGGVNVLGGTDDVSALVWWHHQILGLAVGALGVRVDGQLDVAALADGGRPARFFDVSARPNAPVVFTAGSRDALVPDRLCLAAPATLAFSWQCHYESVRDFDVDPNGQYVLWSSPSGPLQLSALAAAAEGEPFRLDYSFAGDVVAIAALQDAAVKLDARGFVTLMDLPSLNALDVRHVGPGGTSMLLGAARRDRYERVSTEPAPADAKVSAACGDRAFVAETGAGGSAGPGVSGALGTWQLALTAIGVSAAATVTAAAFAPNCGSLVVALEDGTRSDVLGVEIVEPSLLSVRRLVRRAQRDVAGRVRELRFDGNAPGWAAALVETTGDPPSLVRQRIPITRAAVLESLEGDQHGSRSAVALVVGR